MFFSSLKMVVFLSARHSALTKMTCSMTKMTCLTHHPSCSRSGPDAPRSSWLCSIDLFLSCKYEPRLKKRSLIYFVVWILLFARRGHANPGIFQSHP